MQKEEVKKMFLPSSNSILQKLNFIDSLQRLGISYHFQHEIDEALQQIYNTSTNDNVITEEDIFNKFKNNKGDFDQKIAKDVQGLWSLFEASQLRIHGEDILDEALDFTQTHLKSLINQLSSSFAAQISHCLRKPLHRGVPRLEARRYISFYEENPSHCKVLTFSKLDFNMLQGLHKIEVGSFTKWWKKSEFTTKVPYARERVPECYLWPISLSYEPEYSIARRIGSKLTGCISLLDDTYVAYGTIEELELLTQAIQRWDISSIQSLPDSMKVVFNAIIEVCDEVKLATIESKNSNTVVQCVKEAFGNLARVYLTEAKWSQEICIPTYQEYKDNGVISSTYPLMITSFILLAKSAQYVFDWISSNPKIIEVVSLIGRLGNDICSHKFEQERMHVVSAVECCMKQYEISEEDAYKFIEKEIEDLWKVINEECLKSDLLTKPMLDCFLNAARITELAYENFKDKYTDGKLWKDDVIALLVDPISMEKPNGNDIHYK
ncbi:hypothetical protein LR48_Vigan623s000500 [Vigna angularis]|uniref:Terpene synthase N-terminal domain-containing protein n=1 Tax=Phaseolus angularis TaxID=3914 RepID=A0A0L9TEH5_PHAAN|nr:hypothetical protein LR48_Vigan623s000500 [Vigna angularis]